MRRALSFNLILLIILKCNVRRLSYILRRHRETNTITTLTYNKYATALNLNAQLPSPVPLSRVSISFNKRAEQDWV